MRIDFYIPPRHTPSRLLMSSVRCVSAVEPPAHVKLRTVCGVYSTHDVTQWSLNSVVGVVRLFLALRPPPISPPSALVFELLALCSILSIWKCIYMTFSGRMTLWYMNLRLMEHGSFRTRTMAGCILHRDDTRPEGYSNRVPIPPTTKLLHTTWIDGNHAKATHLNSGDSSPISSKSPLPSYSIVPSAASFTLFNRANSSIAVMHSTILHKKRR